MIWVKSEAGRLEIKAKAIISKATTRNLLLLIDGVKTEELLLRYSVGVTADDFRVLYQHGLIEPVPVDIGWTEPPAPAQIPVIRSTLPGGRTEFASVLTNLISAQLGLSGFVLTLTVEKARTMEELHAIADKVIRMIRVRRGDGSANEARRALFGD